MNGEWNELSLPIAVKPMPSGFSISAASEGPLMCSGKHPEPRSFILAGTEEIPHREEAGGKARAALTCGLVD